MKPNVNNTIMMPRLVIDIDKTQVHFWEPARALG